MALQTVSKSGRGVVTDAIGIVPLWYDAYLRFLPPIGVPNASNANEHMSMRRLILAVSFLTSPRETIKPMRV